MSEGHHAIQERKKLEERVKKAEACLDALRTLLYCNASRNALAALIHQYFGDKENPNPRQPDS